MYSTVKSRNKWKAVPRELFLPWLYAHIFLWQFLQIISKIIRKNWNILSVNKSLKKIFFRGNKNLKELIGNNKFENNIVKKKNKSTLKTGKCFPCFRNSRTLCYNEVATTVTLKSQHTQKAYKIFHKVNCFRTYVIYLMECTLCKKTFLRQRLLSIYD